jgi:two-component system sensor histidine kinase MprB
MSFRARITVLVAVTVGLAVAVMALASLQATRSQVYGELDRALAQVARVADGSPGGIGPGGRGPDGRVGAGPPTLLRVSDAVVVQVHTVDDVVRLVSGGTEVAVDPNVVRQARAGSAVTFSTAVDAAPYRGLARPVGDGSVLVVAADASEQQRVLRALVVRFWAIGLAVAGLAAVAGWFAAGRLVAPLRRLTAAAEHVSVTGDLTVDVRTEQPDEAGRLSRAFDEMLAALASSQAAQQRLVDDAGHELRTPITSILSNAEVLKRHPDIDTATREQIADDVIAESQELTRLVNALVDLAGIAGVAESPEQVSVAAVVESARRRLPPDDRGRVAVTGDASAVLRAGQVQRAVVNLLTNATKFSPDPAPVEVSIQRTMEQVDVVVRDHGPGFDDADLPHVFARFYRAESARGVPGSGLGLAIVRDVAQRNGGGVAAGNHPDGGGVVHLTLPATSPPAAPPPVASE